MIWKYVPLHRKKRELLSSGILFFLYYETAKGQKKELNLISWSDKESKYDIRDWDLEYKKMGKGVTLSVEELKKLRNVLKEMELKNEWYVSRYEQV